MHRNWLISRLNAYHPSDPHESAMRDRMLNFVQTYPDCFERYLSIGHITGSAWIVNPSRDKVLLTHHGKLNRWLQLGGHADGDPHVDRVALREAQEESGVEATTLLSDMPFDLDIHEIPPHKSDAAHLHYDVRFLIEIDDAIPLRISSESKDLAWIALDRIADYTTEESVLRMARKTAVMQNNL
ncbi:MAG TPA: NUDIX hydrolase [bacterium]|nr:NUDIX hydrolase [bacterium]HNL26386.1 NUDIX hydrolase [bacterium]HNM15313.1 NUDIX hydrolase [bacterium]